MSLLKAIDTHPSFAPRESGPLPERQISGNPTFRIWAHKAGDSFVMKPGYVGVWKTIETVRKIYVTVT
ncbi:cupin domain-containing protein [Streptomyces coeruleorubidus]|uniref:cupin domain-containing protein n=1 Tax=Streptomyces coeruleorubidus TaxID=116188 RepID=UPI00365E6C70